MSPENSIRQLVRQILSENYPPGAEFDSNAPWREKNEPEPEDIEYNLFPFEVLYYNETISILLNKKDDSKWVLENDVVQNEDLNNETIADYVNSNLKSIDKGVGINAYQYGTSLVKIDNSVTSDLHDEFHDEKLDLTLS
jgi:hypothetical protein